jgi:hypothetical protein
MKLKLNKSSMKKINKLKYQTINWKFISYENLY